MSHNTSGTAWEPSRVDEINAQQERIEHQYGSTPKTAHYQNSRQQEKPHLSVKRFEHAKNEARGRWRSIMSALWPECSQALNDTYIATKKHVTCPRHGTNQKNRNGHGDGFRFYEDFHNTGGGICNTCGGASNGIDLLAKMLDVSAITALEMVESHLGIRKDFNTPARELPPRVVVPEPEPITPEKNAERIKILKTIWDDADAFSELPDDHHGIRYFTECRGIDDPNFVRLQDNLRYNPSLMYRMKDGRVTHYPGIVGLFESSAMRALGVHRTFLDRLLPIKAEIPKQKLMLKRLDVQMNGGVMLRSRTALTSHLSICEGIENGMSVAYAIGRPVLAATSGTLLHGWEPIPGIKAVTIWGDSDASGAGRNYATGLKHRLEELGIKVRILFPAFDPAIHGKSRDWNDLLMQDGKDALIRAYESRGPRLAAV